MKIQLMRFLMRFLGALALFAGLHQALAQGTAFTYQGQLSDSGAVANGNYALRFTLYGDSQSTTVLYGPLVKAPVAVNNGLFTLLLDFGSAAFTGQACWLQIDAAPFSLSPAWLPLSPRLQLTPTPYAIYSESAGTATATTVASAAVAAPQLNTVSPPSAGQVLAYNGTGLAWENPAAAAGPVDAADLSTLGPPAAGQVLAYNGSSLVWVNPSTPLASPPGMAIIPAGAFTMGNSTGDSDITDAATVTVTVSGFYMDVNLVTFSQWQSVYYWATSHGYNFDNAGSGKAANQPVVSVNWYDAVKWCNARSEQAGLTPVYYTRVSLLEVYKTGDLDVLYENSTPGGYRLPTEAEWEKAARGGLSGQRFPWGNTITENLANYYGYPSDYSYDLGPNGLNSIGIIGGSSPATSPVGSFAPNGYGLYDMAGNVDEWCWDWYGTPYGQPTATNPTGPVTGNGYRVLRGGYWHNSADALRCASRVNLLTPSTAGNVIGFRCVRGL